MPEPILSVYMCICFVFVCVLFIVVVVVVIFLLPFQGHQIDSTIESSLGLNRSTSLTKNMSWSRCVTGNDSVMKRLHESNLYIIGGIPSTTTCRYMYMYR